jgi:hypothetical protein
MISIPATNWVGDPPRCLTENACLNVALYMVHVDPTIAHEGIDLMDVKQVGENSSDH